MGTDAGDGGALMGDDEARHLVVAGLLRDNGRGLLLHRLPTRRWYPDCWDLPGGHVDPGEEPQAALQRELREELGIDTTVTGGAFAHVRGSDFRMDIWILDHWDGEPANCDLAEHDALAWVNPEEMTALELADSRLPSLFEAALR